MHLFTEGEGELTYTLLGDPGDLGDLQNPGSVTPLSINYYFVLVFL